MRISTNALTMQWQSAMSRNQTALLRTQLQLATGRKAQSPGDDPETIVRALNLQRGLDRVAIHQGHIETARARLNLEESTLAGVADAVDRLRELAVRAGGPAMDDQGRASIAGEARELFDSILQLANAKDGRGEHLFAGTRVKTRPFMLEGNQVAYHGDNGTRRLQIGDGRSVQDGDSGERVFREILNGNGHFRVTANGANAGTGQIGTNSLIDAAAWDGGDYTVRFVDASNWEVIDGGGAVVASGPYTSGDTISFRGVGFEISGVPAAGDEFQVGPGRRQDLFTTVQDFIATLEAPAPDPVSRTAFFNGLGNSMQDLDRALEHVTNVRTQVGTRISAVESQRDINEGLVLELESTLSTVQDLDYPEAISRLERQLFGFEAAQKAYLETRQLSLFNHL